MTIKTMNKSNLAQYKVDIERRKFKVVQDEMMSEIKGAIGYINDLDHLHELQNYIDDLIRDWEEKEIELEEEDYE